MRLPGTNSCQHFMDARTQNQTKPDQTIIDPASVPGLRIWNSTLNFSSNSEDVCITPCSLLRSQSPLASLEVQSSGTPPLLISKQIQASSEVQSSGSQDSISTPQVMPDSRENKLTESLKTSDIAKYVQQATDSKSEPSSWQPGFIHSRQTRNKKKKKGKPLVFSNSNIERVNTVYPTFFVLKGNDGVRAGEFDVFEVQESLEKVLLHPRTPVSELKDGSLLVEAQCGSDSRALSKLCSVANRPVSSSHNRLDSCQGTIFRRKLLGMSPQYLVQKLRPQHVAKVYRLLSKVNGTLVDSPRLLLTFDVPQLPSEIYAGYLPLDVCS